ncbi:MAG: response regulator transcription factor [Nocardioides sp.]
MSTTVVVADDHPVFRDGLVGLLSDLGAEVVATAANGEEAVAAVAAHAPDVVMMDLQMPQLSGLAATERVRRDHPGTQVLVLTMSEDPATIQAALRAGALGYLLKEATREDIEDALRAVSRGQLVVGTGVAGNIQHLFARTGPEVFPQLSEREHDVLRLLAEGADNATIARRLFLAEKTVRNRVTAVLAKLDVRTRAEAIAKARDAGIGAPTAD